MANKKVLENKFSLTSIFFLVFCKGTKSSIDERAASAMLADQMDKNLGGIATQVSREFVH